MPCHTNFPFDPAKEFWNCCCDDKSPNVRGGRYGPEAEQVMVAFGEVKPLPDLPPRGRSRLDRWERDRRRHELEELGAAASRRRRRDELLKRLHICLRGVDSRTDHGHPPPINFDYVDVPRPD